MAVWKVGLSTVLLLSSFTLSTIAVAGPGDGGLMPARLIISDGPSHDFGVVEVSSSAMRTFTIKNVGETEAENMSPEIINAPFVFQGGYYPGAGGTCSTALEPKASCFIAFSYDANIIGSNRYQYTLLYSSGSQSGKSVTTMLQGQTF